MDGFYYHEPVIEPSTVAALDFATISCRAQLLIGPTRTQGGTLDLLITDVSDQVQVTVVAPLDSSDHSSL